MVKACRTDCSPSRQCGPAQPVRSQAARGSVSGCPFNQSQCDFFAMTQFAIERMFENRRQCLTSFPGIGRRRARKGISTLSRISENADASDVCEQKEPFGEQVICHAGRWKEMRSVSIGSIQIANPTFNSEGGYYNGKKVRCGIYRDVLVGARRLGTCPTLALLGRSYRGVDTGWRSLPRSVRRTTGPHKIMRLD
jgi:hypothetical protein